jgi:hypothetical protein
MNVLPALNNVYENREPQKQWKRAVDIVKEMSEADIALSWQRFSAQIACGDTAEAIIKHSQFKAIFDGVVRDARLISVETGECGGEAGHTNVHAILQKYESVLESQIRRIGEMELAIDGDRRNRGYSSSKTSTPVDPRRAAARERLAQATSGDDESRPNTADQIQVVTEQQSTSSTRMKEIEAKIDTLNTTLTASIDQQRSAFSSQLTDLSAKLDQRDQTLAAMVKDTITSLETLLSEKCDELSNQLKGLDTSINTNT